MGPVVNSEGRVFRVGAHTMVLFSAGGCWSEFDGYSLKL